MKNKIKSLEDISWKVSEKEYREDKALSYSTLSRFKREGFNGLERLFDPISSPSLTFGSMVDVLMTGNIDLYNKTYIAAAFPSISDSLLEVIKSLFKACWDNYKSLKDIPEETILATINMYSYCVTMTKAKRLERVLANEEYYQLLGKTQGKTIVSIDDNNDAYNCRSKLLSSNNTKMLFQEDNPFSQVKRYYQLKFKGDYNGIPIRCMADLLYVDYESKFIIPIDLKTTGKPEWDFFDSFIHWEYQIQARLYWYNIRQNLDKDPYFKDFKLLDYEFVVINRKSLTPLVWKFTETTTIGDITLGKNSQYTLLDWRSLLTELSYYIANPVTVPIGISKDAPNNLIEFINKT